MRRQPDLTLLELQQRLEQVQQLHLSMGWIWNSAATVGVAA
jgi:hypothetical protein